MTDNAKAEALSLEKLVAEQAQDIVGLKTKTYSLFRDLLAAKQRGDELYSALEQTLAAIDEMVKKLPALKAQDELTTE